MPGHIEYGHTEYGFIEYGHTQSWAVFIMLTCDA